VIRKSEAGWLVDSQPGGRGGKRFRKTFKTQSEAKAYDSWLKTQVNLNAHWTPERRDTRRLVDLIETWFAGHGRGLLAGGDTRKRLVAAANAMGNPVADRFSAEDFAAYRALRIASGVTSANMNRELSYLKAMFNELGRLGAWSRANPLASLRAFRVQERELTYLTREQIQLLLAELECARNKHVALITRLSLSTGARWGEAEKITIGQIGSCVVQFAKTKSGRVRAVPISPALEGSLRQHHAAHGQGQRIFGSAWSAFREAIERAAIELPEGQMTHALRHTFASHFVMGGGNILVLQRILGHQSLAMTMRYAHLAPEHLQEAKVLNPLAQLERNEAAEEVQS
jgi:integrase